MESIFEVVERWETQLARESLIRSEQDCEGVTVEDTRPEAPPNQFVRKSDCLIDFLGFKHFELKPKTTSPVLLLDEQKFSDCLVDVLAASY